MDVDQRAMPDPENTGGEETPKNEVEQSHVDAQQPKEEDNTELEALKIKNLELQKQKEHWREKYERDINKPVSSEEPEYLTDDEMTKKEIGNLKKELASFKENQILLNLGTQYPAIKDKAEEFDEFKAEYPGVALDKVAKIFIAEKGYIEQLKPRLGLEKPTGGQKANLKSGISNDDVKRLRESNPRRYEQMLRSGKLNPQDIV